MITVNSEPESAFLVRNDVKYVLETDNLVLTAGVQAECIMVIQALSGNTGTFTISFMGLTVVFTSVSGTPSATAYEFSEGTFANYTDAGNHMILMLKKNYILADNYDITIDVVSAFACSLKIKAKKKGVAYNISFTSTVTDIQPGAVTNGVNAANRDRFKILHDVFLEEVYNSNNYKLLFSGSAVPNADLQAEFNITDILRSALQYDIPAFTFIGNYLNGAAKRIYTRYAESYNFPTEITTAAYTDTKLAILGAQNFVAAAKGRFYDDIFNITPQKFFTAMPQNTMVSRVQKQYLSMYVYNAVRLRIYADLKYTDNTHETVEVVLFDEITVPGVYTFSVGYNQLNIDSFKASGKTVKGYQITFWDAGADEIYSDSFDFRVDVNEQLFARHILFFNSFGMPETMYFTGKQANQVNLKNELVRKADLQFNNTEKTYEGEMSEINNELQFGYELNSGWKPKEWVNYFTDFLLSRKRLVQMATDWVGINIPAQKVALLEDDKYNYAIKFNYQDAFIEKGIAQ